MLDNSKKTLTNGTAQKLVDDIMGALKKVGPYGSIEIYVQNSSVTQITIRNIKKTKHNIID